MQIPDIQTLPPAPAAKSGWPWTTGSTTEEQTGYTAWPKITIVTPSYNQAQFLEETIRSVLLQGYPNLEYIVIDGGSTDGSVEIIRSYEPWLSYWVSEKDRGQSDAINKGFAHSTGDILAWLNSDDTYLPGALIEIAKLFNTYPEAGMIYGNTYEIDENSQVLRKTAWTPYTLRGFLVRKVNVPQQAAFWRRQVFLAVGNLREDLHYGMDADYWLRIALKSRILNFDIVIANFRYSSAHKGKTLFHTFGDELFRILGSFYADPSVPPEGMEVKKRAYGVACQVKGTGFLAKYRQSDDVDDFYIARDCFFRAIRIDPTLLGDGTWCIIYH